MPRLRSPILQHALTPHMLPAAPYLAYSCTACPRAVPPHVQSLLRRLLDRLCRPQPSSRLGAALALRRCAPRLRNQEAAASAYGLELMRELLVALKAADGKWWGGGKVYTRMASMGARPSRSQHRLGARTVNEGGTLNGMSEEIGPCSC